MTTAHPAPTSSRDVEYRHSDDYNIPFDLVSISSSVRQHTYENGRRYHSLNSGTYYLPNDEPEQRRLNDMHQLVKQLLDGRLHMATLPPGAHTGRILDIGTGTGIWAIEMADAHPGATVIGVDLSPIQPDFVPENCWFEVDDIQEPWVWSEKFDFIHSRNIGQGIHDWGLYTRRMYAGLAPGGKVEVVEAATKFVSDDDSIPKGGFIEQYQMAYDKAAAKAGIYDKGELLARYLREAGFVDVKVVIKKCPIGPWPAEESRRRLGAMGLQSVTDQGLRSYSTALFTRYLGMDPKAVEIMCAGCAAEFKSPEVHAHFNVWFVEGRKPE